MHSCDPPLLLRCKNIPPDLEFNWNQHHSSGRTGMLRIVWSSCMLRVLSLGRMSVCDGQILQLTMKHNHANGVLSFLSDEAT